MIQGAPRPVSRPDFEQVFQLMPGMCLVLDPSFTIVAQNDEHARTTLTQGQQVIGRNLFAVYPDNPNDSGASGLAALRESLLRVMKTRKPDVMAIFRHDIRGASGPYQARYWAVTNSPILGADGFVQWIINRAEDVTALVEPRLAAGG